MQDAVGLADGRVPSIILPQKRSKAADVMPHQMMVTTDGGEGKQNKYTAGSPTVQDIDHTICGTSNGQMSPQDVSPVDINMLCTYSV